MMSRAIRVAFAMLNFAVAIPACAAPALQTATEAGPASENALARLNQPLP